MFNINLITSKTIIRNILFCLTLIIFVSKAATQEQIQIQKFALKKIDIGQDAYNASEGNFAISHDDAIDLFDNIKSSNRILIHPSNFAHLVKHIGIMDVKKYSHLDGQNLLFVTLNQMSFESINDVITYLERYNIQPENVAMLDVTSNNIAKITKKEMEKFSNLMVIDLSRNRISNVHSNAFEKCNLLCLINLQFNQIKFGLNEMIEKFHKSPDIRFSAVNNNPINDTEREILYNFYFTTHAKSRDSKNNTISYLSANDPEFRDVCFLLTAINHNKDDSAKKFMSFLKSENLFFLFKQEKYKRYNPFLTSEFCDFINIALKVVEEIKQEKLLEDALNDLLD